MGGVIAHFKEIRVPSNGREQRSHGQTDVSAAERETGVTNDSRSVSLRVWTSEGVDRADSVVKIIVPPDVGAVCSENADGEIQAKRR